MDKIRKQHKIKEWMSRTVVRSYCFDEAEVGTKVTR